MDFEAEARLIENDVGIQRNRRENHPSRIARDCGVTCMECVFDLGLAIFFPIYEWCCKPWNVESAGQQQRRQHSYGNLVPTSECLCLGRGTCLSCKHDMDIRSDIAFQPLIDDTGEGSQSEHMLLSHQQHDEAEALNLGYMGVEEHGPNSRYHKEDPVVEDAEM